MSAAPALHAFEAYGIELEYMIVERKTLAIMPIADGLLQAGAGEPASDVHRGDFGWSNEIVLHLIEIKNVCPHRALDSIVTSFQQEVNAINGILNPMGARLMPGAMHPWMDPGADTQLWPHDNAPIYQAYDRIFNCRQHGQANLQSMHVNLPFADDEEFARLHAAVRLLLPVLPAIGASSPIFDGKASGYLDSRVESYRTAVQRIPSVIGEVIPDTVNTRAQYEAQILARIYQDVAPFDQQGLLRHEWLNARGAIPRFERNAIEIRLIDIQECPLADLAIAAASAAVVRALYDGAWSALAMQQACSTSALAAMLRACIRDAEQAVIDDADYLSLFAFPDRRCQAGELWCHLIEATPLKRSGHWREPLRVLQERGPLARRILRSVGRDCSKAHLQAVYGELCDCLAEGRMFLD